MGRPCKILVADRNRHVRELLRRELAAEGYQVQVARDGHEVGHLLNGAEPPDLVILDPEIPFLEELATLAHFQEQEPSVPLVVYAFAAEYALPRAIPKVAAVLEKKEDTDRLKQVVAEVIHQYYPHGALP